MSRKCGLRCLKIVGMRKLAASAAFPDDQNVGEPSPLSQPSRAVFCQLFWGWSEHGEWAQTIHFGYVDDWMWSGHRVGWLPFMGWVYGLDPDPVWLTRIQIAVLSLGKCAYDASVIEKHETEREIEAAGAREEAAEDDGRCDSGIGRVPRHAGNPAQLQNGSFVVELCLMIMTLPQPSTGQRGGG